MVSRRPQHPVSPSLPPVHRAPGDISLDQVEAILRDLVADVAPDPGAARGHVVPPHGRRPLVFPRFPITDQAVAKRIAEDDGATIRAMVAAISSLPPPRR
ncbi:MAG: hypothetical protein EXR45_07995 [Chloroflexi bacterium]|nr:hypothetical protein [Chloroflexota bacterium]